MKNRTQARLMICATLVGLGLLGSQVLGQVRVNNGHANDANTRVGSGGLNDNPTSPGNAAVTNNAITTQNVTGLFGFSGANVNGVNLGVGYTNPFAFRGLIAGEGVDQFIAASSGVPTMNNPTASSQSFVTGTTATPFYGTASTVGPPPPNFVRNSATGGYTPAPATTYNPEDVRLGAPLDVPYDSGIPKTGEVMLPGQVDPTSTTTNSNNGNVYYVASPIYGVRQWQLGQDQQNLFSPQSSQFGPMGPVERAQQQQLQNLRQELEQENESNLTNPSNPNQNQSGNQSAPYLGTGATYLGTGANQLPTLKAGDNPNSGQALTPLQNGNSQQVNTSNLTSTAGNMSTQQSNRQYLLTLPPPTAQSTQYALLRQRLDQYNNSHPLTDEEANREFTQLIQTRRAVVAAQAAQGQQAVPGAPGAGATPPGQTAPGAPGATGESANPMQGIVPPAAGSAAPVFPATPAEPPLQIGSLSTGVRSTQLAGMLKHGEELIKNQQYDKAVAVFDAAAGAVPNNPLILIGRAEAELGGSYYHQAEVDLRTAFRQDPAMLMGQYDLTATLGEKRLQYLINELKEIANDSPEAETPAFLLAFVTYNSHHEDQTAQWLAAAEKRAGGSDPTLTDLKRYWGLQTAPATQPSAR